MNLTGDADFPGNAEGLYNSQVVELANGTFLMYVPPTTSVCLC